MNFCITSLEFNGIFPSIMATTVRRKQRKKEALKRKKGAKRNLKANDVI